MTHDEWVSDGEPTIFAIGDSQEGGQPIDLKRAYKSGKWPFLTAIPCRICQKPSRLIRHIGFCREHNLARLERQARGVSRDELSPVWEDTLATWNDRPDALGAIAEPARFRYWGPLDEGDHELDWMLFERGYPSRLPDWLLYNKTNGAVRRFAGSAYEEVAEEMLGGNKVPEQANLDEVWGQAGVDQAFARHQEMLQRFSGLSETAQSGDFQLPRVDEVVRGMDFAVYGLFDEFMDLGLASFCYGGGVRGYENVSLSFSDGDKAHTDATRALFVESNKKQFRVIHQEPDSKRWHARSAADAIWGNFAPRALRDDWFSDPRGPFNRLDDLGEPETIRLQSGLVGFPHETDAMVWQSHTIVIYACVLEDEKSRVEIATLGLQRPEVEELTSHLGPVNERRDVLSRYQARMDEHMDALRRSASQENDS